MDSARANSASTIAPAIEAVDLVRRFEDVTALDHVSLSIQRGEFFSLLGPSGCGKTTFLRIVAGLDAPDAGALRIGGRDVLPVPAHRRPVNTVFQSYALFPHMTVEHNVAFGLKMKKLDRAEIEARVQRAMDMVQITSLRSRRPHQISGGQKQRVALARALVNEPDVLLLDEPLGALDVKLRRELQDELHALQRRLGITFVHVTHDQDEALGLSDRLAVMNHGVVVQAGTPVEIYERPRTAFVAQFVGGCNLIPARAGAAGLVETALGPLRLALEAPVHPFTLALRPERIVVGAAGAEPNSFTGVVTDVTYTGPESHLSLRCGTTSLKAVVLNTADAHHFGIGQSVTCAIPPAALFPLAGDSDKT